MTYPFSLEKTEQLVDEC